MATRLNVLSTGGEEKIQGLHLPAGRVGWKDDGTCLWHRNCGAFDDDSLDVCRVPANTCRLAHGCSAKVCGRDCWRLDRKVFHAGDLFPSASKLRECDALDPCVVANLLGTAGFPCTDSRCSDPAAVLQVSGRWKVRLWSCRLRLKCVRSASAKLPLHD